MECSAVRKVNAKLASPESLCSELQPALEDVSVKKPSSTVAAGANETGLTIGNSLFGKPQGKPINQCYVADSSLFFSFRLVFFINMFYFQFN